MFKPFNFIISLLGKWHYRSEIAANAILEYKSERLEIPVSFKEQGKRSLNSRKYFLFLSCGAVVPHSAVQFIK